MNPTDYILSFRAPPRFLPYVWFDACARRFPIGALVIVVLASNLAGSFFNFFYNTMLIVPQLNQNQQNVFWNTAHIYNIVSYPLCMAVGFRTLRLTIRALGMLRPRIHRHRRADPHQRRHARPSAMRMDAHLRRTAGSGGLAAADGRPQRWGDE